MRSISSPKSSTPHGLLFVGREDLDRVAAHAEGAALERDVVAPVLDATSALQDVVARWSAALSTTRPSPRYDSGSPKP
jgi:hypothetical protein